MQKSRLAMKAGANGEKTGEREEDAAVNCWNRDTQYTKEGNEVLRIPKHCLIRIPQSKVILFSPRSDRQVAGRPRVQAEEVRTLLMSYP